MFTGSLESMDDKMPRRNVFVKELDCASKWGDTAIEGPGSSDIDGPELTSCWSCCCCCKGGAIFGGDRAVISFTRVLWNFFRINFLSPKNYKPKLYSKYRKPAHNTFVMKKLRTKCWWNWHLEVEIGRKQRSCLGRRRWWAWAWWMRRCGSRCC